ELVLLHGGQGSQVLEHPGGRGNQRLPHVAPREQLPLEHDAVDPGLGEIGGHARPGGTTADDADVEIGLLDHEVITPLSVVTRSSPSIVDGWKASSTETWHEVSEKLARSITTVLKCLNFLGSCSNSKNFVYRWWFSKKSPASMKWPAAMALSCALCTWCSAPTSAHMTACGLYNNR